MARNARWLDQLLDVALPGTDAAEFRWEVARTLPDPTDPPGPRP